MEKHNLTTWRKGLRRWLDQHPQLQELRNLSDDLDRIATSSVIKYGKLSVTTLKQEENWDADSRNIYKKIHAVIDDLIAESNI